MTTQLWKHFAGLAGRENLIPIAPSGVPSEKSKLAESQIGKIPSRYLGDGKVVGFAKWSQHHATEAEFKRWSEDGRYNVGIITGRGLYAIDADITDEKQHAIIEATLAAYVGEFVPFRTRGNSRRRLYAVRIEGEPLSKRVLKLEGLEDGKPLAVEFLGDGQQFVAAGRHPSGADYEWYSDDPLFSDAELPDSFPELSRDAFMELWESLRIALPVDVSTVAGVGRKRELVLGQELITDETAQFFDDNGITLSIGYQSERYIRSPREHLYSMVSETSVAYFPGGTGGFEQGHFKSMHSSDADLSDNDWLDLFGLRIADFDILPDEVAADGGVVEKLPAFKRDKKGIINSFTNLQMAIASPRACGYDVKYDTFKQMVYLDGEPVADVHATRIAVNLERIGFQKVSSAQINEMLMEVADTRKYDSLIDWCNTLTWDGVERVESFFTRAWGIPASTYTEAVARYMWTALAGRALVPGIKADMAVLLVSEMQGKGKSSGVAAMAPPLGAFSELDFGDSGPERIRKLQGRCVIEISELKGMTKREMGEIRSFISAQQDASRRLYGQYYSDLFRRCVFIGTTNDDDPLNDTAGNRRWLPLTISDNADAVAAVTMIQAERDQLWAEGIQMFLKSGILWQDAQNLARNVIPEYETRNDGLVEVFEAWLTSNDLRDAPSVCLSDFISDCFPNVVGEAGKTKSIDMTISRHLRGLKYVRVREMREGVRRYYWYKKFKK